MAGGGVLDGALALTNESKLIVLAVVAAALFLLLRPGGPPTIVNGQLRRCKVCLALGTAATPPLLLGAHGMGELRRIFHEHLPAEARAALPVGVTLGLTLVATLSVALSFTSTATPRGALDAIARARVVHGYCSL